MKVDKLNVLGMGLISSIGENVDQSVAAVNAGISRFHFSSFLNRKLLEIKLAEIPHAALPPLNDDIADIAALSGRTRRLLQIITKPLQEALSGDVDTGPIPVFLALPEGFPGYVLDVPKQFLQCVSAQTGASLDLANSRMIRGGKAAGVEAVAMAFRFMDATGKHFALVGGVDTFIDTKLLSVLGDRVSCEGNMDSFIPSEAGCFMLLASDEKAQSISLKAPRIGVPALATEEGHRYSDKPMVGDGLTAAMSGALNNSTVAKFPYVYTSMNGENCHAKELGVATIRNSHRLTTDWSLETPLDCLGDIGAATAPTMICLATKLNKLPCIAYANSDSGACGSLCVTGPK